MFKKKIPFRFVLNHFCFFSRSNSFPLELKGNRDVFQIVNKTKNVTLFVSDRKEVNAFSLNENMLIVDSNRKTKKIYGHRRIR
jgi:hypothetical protein